AVRCGLPTGTSRFGISRFAPVAVRRPGLDSGTGVRTMTSQHLTRRAAALATALGLAITVAPAAATDGPLYWRGQSISGVRAPFTATPVGSAVQIRQAATATTTQGNVWEMNWGCDVPVTVFAQVCFGALRTAAPCQLAYLCTGYRAPPWVYTAAIL